MKEPTGLVTFLFTDIENSTKLSQEFPDSLPVALEKHHAIMHKATETNNGFVFEIVGDAFCCAFENAEDAVKAAVGVQINLANEKWDDVKIKIRIGIHSGNVEWNGKRYMGYITLARTARVMSSAYGEQIIISNDTYELCFPKLPARDSFQKSVMHITGGGFGKEGLAGISFRDLGERRLKDLKQPVRLFQILSEGLREDFPPLKTLDARPNNLPVQLTSFIGREAEMKQVKDLLKQTHLLTLTGSGGAGKTRFALQVGADVIDDFANGVWFVELASLSEQAFLPQAIMKVFDLKEEPKRSLEDTLCDYLHDKEMLILLDNCEHLVESCAKLTEKLLSNSPKLKIIATSREGLRCDGEQTHRVLSLEVPDPKEENSPEKLSQYEAVRLFIERALAVDSEFRVNNNNAPALAQICFQLDGIPLAIELAAARTKVLTVEQIYERLNDRFNLLTGGKRTALPRQQTLRALIDWSYDLLSEKEQILWRRLSVFSGGWTLEAAEEVCSDEKIKKEEVLEMLNQLTEKSIIVFEREKERYMILETLKQYGGEKLKETNETEDVLAKHLNFFIELAETAATKLLGVEIAFWIDKIEAEHLNFQSAIECSLNRYEIEKGARIAGNLGNFWSIRGHYSVGRVILENILAKEHAICKSDLTILLKWEGIILMNQGEYSNAMNSFKESLSLNRMLKQKHGIASSLTSLAAVTYYQGNYEDSQRYTKESLDVFVELNDKTNIAVALGNLGNLTLDLGNYEQAQMYLEKSLALSRELRDYNKVATSLFNLGSVLVRRGNYEQAHKYFEEGSVLVREFGDKRETAYYLNNLGVLATIGGSFEQALIYLMESIKLFRELDEKRGIAFSLDSLGNAAYRFGDYENARVYCEESLSLFRKLGDKLGLMESIVLFSWIVCASNNLSSAVILLGAVEEAKKSMGLALERIEQNHHEQIMNELHEKLTNEEFSKYFEEGKKLTLEQAAELALTNVQ